jgi:hypothetical protein
LPLPVPELRQPKQQSFFDTLVTPPPSAPPPTSASPSLPEPELQPRPEPRRPVFELAPADAPYACMVTTLLVGEPAGVATAIPAQIAADAAMAKAVRDVAHRLREAESRTCLPAADVDALLHLLMRSDHARWHAGGQRLKEGETRIFPTTSVVTLPPRSGVILGANGPWYVDAATGAVGRMRIRPPVAAPQSPPAPGQPQRRAESRRRMSW